MAAAQPRHASGRLTFWFGVMFLIVGAACAMGRAAFGVFEFNAGSSYRILIPIGAAPLRE
jgi:hypothetical protein